ncbi:MAG: phosphate regulon sensor histidine kinase PhoR [bacterium]
MITWVAMATAMLVVWIGIRYALRRRRLADESDQESRVTEGGASEGASNTGLAQSDLQSSMSSLPDAVMLTGGQWQIKWANDTACEWFGIDLDRHLEQPIWRVVEMPGFVEYLSKQDYSSSFECTAPGNANIHLDIRIVPYQAGQVLVQGRDISKIKQLEQIRRDFVANASHELRTPLSILYGYLEMMQDEGNETISQEWKPAVHQMFEQTRRIKQIIDDMMLLSRLEEVDGNLKLEYTPMAPLMETACQDAEALGAQKGHKIEKDIDENYSLFCNNEEIQSLVMNLISNAVRYTPDDGVITVKWKVDLVGGNLSVIDSGIGIEEESIPRLTERFYRSDPARSRAAGGTGLGLAIVNHIVNRHHAQLSIKSKLGKGSEFIVQFPSESIRADHEQVNLLLN